jgi:tetratricopeptide (TPR) repeat protein
MNSLLDILPLDQLIPLGFLVVAGFRTWYAADMRSIVRSMQRKNELTLEGRWAELEQHLKRDQTSRRPFAWFYKRYLLPGNSAAQVALFLHQQGRFEEALAKIDQAIKQIENKPAFLRPLYRRSMNGIHCSALATRVLILSEMGRYDEARDTATRLAKVSGSNVRPNSSLALVEAHCGRLDEALALARTVAAESPRYDTMRILMAKMHGLKGDYAQAVETLTFEPASISKFDPSKGLENIKPGGEVSKLKEMQGRKLAGAVQHSRWMMLAGAYLQLEAFENADRALDEAEKFLGSNPAWPTYYCAVRARSYGAQGRSAEANEQIARARVLMQQSPRRSTQMETHLAIGRAYLSLRRFGEALAELAEAQRLASHPMEKHQTAYWLARTQEAAGNRDEAMRYFRQVASDPIPSWMQREAAAVSNNPAPTIPPPSRHPSAPGWKSE